MLEESHNVGNGRSLLSNGDIDTVKRFSVVSGFEVDLLVKNSINSNSSLTSLTISNDKLTLSSSNWHLY